MGTAANLPWIVAAGGFLLAFVFGAVANRTNFCTMGAVSDIVNMGHWGHMRMRPQWPMFTMSETAPIVQKFCLLYTSDAADE